MILLDSCGTPDGFLFRVVNDCKKFRRKVQKGRKLVCRDVLDGIQAVVAIRRNPQLLESWMLFLIPLAVEAAPAIAAAAAEAAPAIAAAAAEAAPVVEAAIASAEAAFTGSAATTAAATATAEAAAGSATGAAAEAGTSAATRAAASRLMSKEGEEAVMSNVKAHAEEATTKAAVETDYAGKLRSWVETGLKVKAGSAAATAAVMGGFAAYAGYNIWSKMASDASESLGMLHKGAQEGPEVAQHHKEAIDKFATQAANYGMATNLAKDTAHIIKDIQQENSHLNDSIVEFRMAMTAASGIAGMEGMHAVMDRASAQAQSIRDLDLVQTNLLTSPGRLSQEDIKKTQEVLDTAAANFRYLADSKDAKESAIPLAIAQTQKAFAGLTPFSDVSKAKEALTDLEAVRHDMRVIAAKNGDLVADRLSALGDKHGEDLHKTVKELMPQIAELNARNIVQHLEQQRSEPAKTQEASAAQSPAHAAAPAQQASAQPGHAQNNGEPPQIGNFKAPAGFPVIGEMSR